MNFPDGPFFNFRTKCEFPFWKRIVWIVFGKRKDGTSGGCFVSCYYFRGVTYIHRIEPTEQES